MNENLKKYQKIIDFIKTLDDEGIEIFIQVGKENRHNIGDENKLRETLKNIRDGK